MKQEQPKKSVLDALGLPPIENVTDIDDSSTELYLEDDDIMEDDDISVEEAKMAMQKLKEMRVQLKDIPDITSRKTHLDRLADLAERKFEDIFDRAFNCEDRFASEMINAANAMLKIALDAHAKIIDSDIKLVDMQIKKDKMEIELNSKGKGSLPQSTVDPNAIEGEKVQVKTRNDMLASIKANK